MDNSYPYVASLTREAFLFFEMLRYGKVNGGKEVRRNGYKGNCREESFPVSNGEIHHTYGKSLY